MKKNKLFGSVAMFALALTMGACINDSNPNPGPEVPEEVETGYFSVKLMTPDNGVHTRALVTENGHPGESYVNEVWVMLYSRGGNGDINEITPDDVLKYAWNLTIHNYNLSSPGSQPQDQALLNFTEDTPGHHLSIHPSVTQGTRTCTTAAEPVVSANYYLVVIANPSTLYANGLTKFSPLAKDETFEGQPFYKLEDLASISGCDFRGTPGVFTRPIDDPGYMFKDESEVTRFLKIPLMSNANGLVPIVPEQLRENPAAAETNPVHINIDRAMAKIIVNAANKDVENTVYAGGKVYTIGWEVSGLNTKSYVYRHYANYAMSFGGAMETFTTSITSGMREFMYATDPNFDSTDPSEVTVTGNYIYWNDIWEEISPGTEVLREYYFGYALENTLSLEQLQDPGWAERTSHVYLRAKITFDGLPADGSTQGYYSWNAGDDITPDWRVFTLSQAKTWRTNGVYPTGLGGLKTLIGDDSTTPNPTPGTSSFFDAATAGDMTIPDVNIFYPIVVTDAAQMISFHPSGLNEYWVPIRHFSLGTDNRNIYGQYGVVRNNVYRINITSIQGPGVPGKSWIAVDVNIQPWVVRTSGEELENPRN